MTAMPQLVSLFNAVGGGAAALIAIDDYLALRTPGARSRSRTNVATVLDIIIGSITFTGSLIASGKLQGLIRRQADHDPGRPARDRWRSPLVTVVGAVVPVRDRHAERRRSCSSSWPRR